MAAPICLPKLRFLHGKTQLKHYSSSVCRRRVVVTGLGLVTCLGVGVDHTWKRLCDSQCGIVAIKQLEFADIPCRVAGFVPRGDQPGSLNLSAYFSTAELRNLPLSTAFAHIAADEAIKDCGWRAESENERCRAGVALGTGMADLQYIANVGATFRDKGVKKVSPHFIPSILLNMPAGAISIKHQLKGPNHCVSTACSTGLVAIGDASNLIRHGSADIMIAGGTEASINPLTLTGFSRLRALSVNFNDRPESASRPFDKLRDGFVMSEGAGVVVLEEYEHAKRRGASIYCEVLGYGIVGDAYHMTAPQEDGYGAVRSMSTALVDSRVYEKDVGYINAHATSTPLGDIAECRAINTLFGDHARTLFVSSTKGAVGHLQGAAGAVEAIFTILSTYSGVIPPTVNLQEPDEENELNCVPNVKQSWSGSDRRVSLTNSFGFWGSNATLCFGQFDS